MPALPFVSSCQGWSCILFALLFVTETKIAHDAGEKMRVNFALAKQVSFEEGVIANGVDKPRNAAREVMEKDKEVLFAYLYGSYAQDSVRFESDIDVAVYLKPSDIKEYIKK